MENPNKVSKSVLDRISSLPDVALHDILSCLDMKEVIQTSLLSSRWRYLWTSLPVVNCNRLLWIRENDEFVDFVDRVLLLRDGSGIKKFQLCCSHYYDSDRINVWITSAVRRHLQEMHLQFFPHRQIELPRAIFSPGITSLELNLASGHNAIHIEIPNLICSLTGLVTLILISVRLPKGNSSGELLFTFPILENLRLIECRREHLKVLNISTPQLKAFLMLSDSDPKSRYDKYENCCRMELCAPNLQSLELSCKCFIESGGIVNFQMRNLSSLVSVKFNFRIIDSESVVKLLEAVSSAKTIDIDCSLFADDSSFSRYDLISQYLNLRCLKLKVNNVRADSLNYALRMFPCIETLHLFFEGYTRWVEGMFDHEHYFLKYLEIGLLIGDKADYKLLETILKNMIVLEKLVIKMEKMMPNSAKEAFGEKIISLPRASPRVAIFYYCF